VGVIKDEQEEKLKPAGKGHALCSSGSYGPLACPSVYVVASYWLHYSRTVAFFSFSRGQHQQRPRRERPMQQQQQQQQQVAHLISSSGGRPGVSMSK